jgi:Flp pilus assembly protein TadD
MPAGIADPALRIELGETLTDAGDHDQAYEAIDQALQGATGEVREAGYVALGRLFFKLRRPTESAAYFEKALVENPRNLRAMIGRGVALDITGKFDQAQAVYLKALEVAPGDLRAQNNLALSYAFAGNFARAVEILHPMATAATATIGLPFYYLFFPFAAAGHAGIHHLGIAALHLAPVLLAAHASRRTARAGEAA